jgi:hypothetical protein
MEESLKNERLEVREFLERCGLVESSCGESDELDWLEGEVIKLADTVARRERLLKLIRAARDTLNHQRGEQQGAQRQADLPDMDKKPRPSTSRKFRRFIF